MSSSVVSVVIPTYNRAALVSEAVASVIAQTFESVEVIVVDDGSTDDTVTVLSGIGDERLRYERIDHAGPSVARNRGIELASGEFIAFLDSDDLWYPSKLERQLPLFADADLGWTYTDLDYLGPQGPEPRRFERLKPCRGWVMESLFVDGCPMLTSSVIVRRSCLDQTGLFDPGLLRWQDNDLYFRLARLFQVDFVHEPLGRYWHRPRIRSVSQKVESRRRHRLVKRRAMELEPELLGCSRKKLRRAYLNSVFRLGRMELALNNVPEARRLFRECLSFQPFWLKPAAALAASYLPGEQSTRLAGLTLEDESLRADAITDPGASEVEDSRPA